MKKFIYLILFILLVSGCKNTESVKIKVSFDTDGGNEIPSIIVDPKKGYTLPTPEKDGYEFEYWTIGVKKFDGDFTGVKTDIILVAVWKPIEEVKNSYIVTFNTGGGTNIPSKTVEEGNKVARPADPQKDGYTFDNWYLNNALFNFDTPITSNIELEAVYIKDGETVVEHTVTIEVDGVITTQKIISGKKLSDLGTREKQGYKFIEWRLNGVKYDFNTPVSGDIKLVAYFEIKELETFQVSFIVDGEIISTESILEGNKVNMPSTNPSKQGYTFIEWQLNNSKFNFNNPITSNISLIAKFLLNNTDDFSPAYSVEGFAQNGVSIPNLKEGDSGYYVVHNEQEFMAAIKNKGDNGATRVIELRADMNLGDKELIKKYGSVPSGLNPPDSKTNPKTHPKLIESGITRLNIDGDNGYKDGLYIFSNSGHAIRHTCITVRDITNFAMRNIVFEELWEWDEKSAGEYDENDWDMITVRDASYIWFDHLTLKKSYDGQIDLKNTGTNVTISWSNFSYEFDDPFVKQQFDYMEANRSSFPYYNQLRSLGMTKEDITKMSSGQKKGFLAGPSKSDDLNKGINLTIHNSIIKNLHERLPRLRAGDAHLYNCYVDNTELLAMREEMLNKYNAIFTNKDHSGHLAMNLIVSTEDGALLIENSVFKNVYNIMRTNQQTSKDDAQWIGKYKFVNSIYQKGSVDFKGGSEDPNTPFVRDQAIMTIKPFSWNKFSSLPYDYTLIPVENLESILFTNSIVGATSDFSLIK